MRMKKYNIYGWIFGLLLMVACSEGKDEPDVNKPEQPEQTAVGCQREDGRRIGLLSGKCLAPTDGTDFNKHFRESEETGYPRWKELS